jgi:bacterioferritin-associated ferredoxin
MKIHERGEYPPEELKDAYNKYCYYNTVNKHKMIDIPVYKVPQEYRIQHEIHNKCGTAECCGSCSKEPAIVIDPTVNKEVYVNEEDGDVGC